MSSLHSEGWLISSPLLEDTTFFVYRKTVEIRLIQIRDEIIKVRGFKLIAEESNDNLIVIKLMKHGKIAEISANKLKYQFVEPVRIIK